MKSGGILPETAGRGGDPPLDPAAAPAEPADVVYARIRAACQHAANGIDLDTHAGLITALVLTARATA